MSEFKQRDLAISVRNRYLLHTLRGTAALCIFLSILPFASLAQTDETDSLFQAVPFNQWVADGPKTQLPWRTRTVGPTLSFHQRIIARFEIMLDGNDVAMHCCGRRAVALLQITDFHGRTFRNFAVEDIKQSQGGIGQYVFTLFWDVFLVPGDYQVVMALYYSGTPGHNLSFQKLHVNPVKDDPLLEAWRNLPNVEFCDPQPEGVNKFLLPRVTGQLNLPIKNRRPIRLEILENLTPYPGELRKPKRYQQELSIMLPLLKSLSQVQLTNGSVDVAAMDFTRSRVTFEQKNVLNGRLDLAGLKDMLDANPITILNAPVYGDPHGYGKYFAQEITQRLIADSSPTGSPNNRPVRVLIIVSGRMEFSPQPIIAPPKDSDFVVFYLRFSFLPRVIYDWPAGIYGPFLSDVEPLHTGQMSALSMEQLNDGIGKVLRDLKPRVYSVDSEVHVRRAMAAIIRELSQM